MFGAITNNYNRPAVGGVNSQDQNKSSETSGSVAKAVQPLFSNDNKSNGAKSSETSGSVAFSNPNGDYAWVA